MVQMSAIPCIAELRVEAEMKPFTVPVLSVALAEVGAALVMLNASPHAPLGFWLWFGGLAALFPFAGYWLYRRMTAKA